MEEDRREYYENLGKWDQFVFGWDDFMRPDDYASLPGNEDYAPTGDPEDRLREPWVSANREIVPPHARRLERRLQDAATAGCT